MDNSITTTAVEDKVKHVELVVITVNKKDVRIEGPKATGFEIKEAAIAQGVAIQLDFQLALVRPNGKREIIRDDQKVNVDKKSTFIATAADDNS